MKSRQVTGLIALILVVLGLGVLTWFTYGLGRNEIATAVPAAMPAEETKPAASAATPAPAAEKPATIARAESSLERNKDESRVGDGSESATAPAPSASTETPTAPTAPAEPAAQGETKMDSAPAASEKPAAPAEMAAVEPQATPAAPGGEVGMSVTGRKSPAAEGSNIPTFDVVRVEPTGDTALAGLSAPGAKVELMDGNNVIAKADANSRGEWTIILDKPLTPGTHDLALRATSPDGGEQFLSEQRVAVAVPDKGSRDVLAVVNEPGAPSRVLDKPSEGASVASAQPAPMADRFTNAEPEAGAAEPAAPGVTVDAVEADPDGGVYVAGAAKTQDSVRVYLNDELVGEAKPGPGGKWLLEDATRKIDPGKYTVRADQVNKAGDVIVRAEVPFERDAEDTEVAALAPSAEAGGTAGGEMSGSMASPTTVIIRRGDNLWKISRRWYGHGIRYSTIYEANTDQIRNPDLIYPGQVFVMPSGDIKWKTE